MKFLITVLKIIALIIAGSFIAGLYGILHDQITFTIAPEYFTKFKFIQFRHMIFLHCSDRFNVSVIGFLATYWVGTFVASLLGLVNLIIGAEELFAKTLKAFLIVLLVTACFWAAGYAAGRIITANCSTEQILGWGIYFPRGIKDVKGFMTVGFIHNFSYLGGFAGMIAGNIWLVRNRKKQK